MKILTVIMVSFVLTTAFAKGAKYNVDKSLFIGGYDPVAYIVSNKAIKGKESIQHVYNGIKIQFSSEENKKKFIKDPEKMLPAYNGWCAYAMSKKGTLVEVDPKSFKVIQGKTYLFYDSTWADTLKKWNKKNNDTVQVKQANINWKKNYLE